MTRYGWIVTALASLLLVTAAEAGPKANKGDLHCPPGLAKKDPPCIPPGQAKKHATSDDTEQTIDDYVIYTPGDFLTDDYIVLINPWIYRPDLNAVYVRYGDYLYLIDREGAYILDRIGPVADWTWDWADTDFANCPPGLAKKDPPCVPPGLAKKGVTARMMDRDGQFDPYGIGDQLPDGYVTLIDPQLFTPNDSAYYVRSGDTLYRIDPVTRQVLDVIGNLVDLLD